LKNKYQQYEAAKRELQAKNLPQDEYEKAVREIARRLRI
jgi:hypothetical protein